MKFKYSLSPNYKHKVDTKQIMRDFTIALLFVSLASSFLQFNLYGITGVVRALAIQALAVATCCATDYVYFKMIKTKKIELKHKIQQSVPIITGLVLSLTLPLGNLNSFAIFYVVFISSIVAELFGKLIYGGFGYNIFNPAAVGRAFALISFGPYLIAPTIDGLASTTVLEALSSPEGINAVHKTFHDYTSLIFGSHQGAIGETIIIPIAIAAIYLIYKNVIDWVIPFVAIITMAILAGISGYFTGIGIEAVLLHLTSGGLIFGAVFMLTDPVTGPINRQGKIIFAIIFALITFLIRTKSSLPEGVVFAILICNILVPTIDHFTANITNVNINKKSISIASTMAVAIVLTILFQYV